MGAMKITPEEMREGAAWMDNQKEQMQTAIRQANEKINHIVENSYNTPQAKAKFEPMWQQFRQQLEQGVDEMTQIGDYLRKTADAFEETDNTTASGVG
ncbi:WXG100 family type VII secretion target [Streptomyces sp. NPDC002520]